MLDYCFRIKLIPFLTEGNFTTGGEIWVTMSCVEPSNTVVFNNNNITIDAESVTLQDLKSGQFLPITQQVDFFKHGTNILLRDCNSLLCQFVSFSNKSLLTNWYSRYCGSFNWTAGLPQTISPLEACSTHKT